MDIRTMTLDTTFTTGLRVKVRWRNTEVDLLELKDPNDRLRYFNSDEVAEIKTAAQRYLTDYELATTDAP